MLKEKNLIKALEIVNAEGVKTDIPLEAVAQLQVELEIAERAYAEHAAKVKKHNNEIYAPMCEKKAQLEIEMHKLRIRFEKVVEKNPGFAALVKLAKKAAKK